MNAPDSLTLGQYVAEQITDYITTQTEGKLVSPQKMKILENGVQNICISAYPENENLLSKHVPRIIRAALDIKQLGISGKMQRIIDATHAPKDEIIIAMLRDITVAKSTAHITNNISQNSWVDKIQTERSTQTQGANNAR